MTASSTPTTPVSGRTDAPASANRAAARAGTLRFETQRAALEEVMGLSSHCATTYEHLEKVRAEAAARAEATLARARMVMSAQYSARSGIIRSEAETAIAEHERVFAEARDKIHREAAGKRAELDQKQRRTAKQLTKEHGDATWLVDTMLEGESARIEEATSAFRKTLQDHATELENLQTRADALARRHGHSVPLADVAEAPHEGEPANPDRLAATLERRRRSVEARLAAMRRLVLPRLFQGPAPWLLGLLALLVAAGAGQALSVESPRTLERILQAPPNWGTIGLALGIAVVALAGLYWGLRGVAMRQIRAAGRRFSEALEQARAAARADRTALTQQFDDQLVAAKVKHEADTRAANARHKRHVATAQSRYDALLGEINTTAQAAEAEAARQRDAGVGEAQARHDRGLAQLNAWRDQQVAAMEQARDEAVAVADGIYRAGQAELVSRWERALRIARDLSDESDRPEFSAISDWRAWRPPEKFAPTVRFGELAVDMRRFTGEARETESGEAVIGGSNGDGLRLPIPEPFSVPALLGFPDHANLLIKHEPAGRDAAIATLRLTMLRLLTSLPPGRVRFTLIDPVGLGRSFAAFMHLADYDEELVGGRVWTESDDIERRLTDLTEHMETVIQKYLRNEFETIDAYNAQAGELAEPYRFVVIADLPTGFSEKAMARLASIAASGTRCGVHVLAALDTRQSVQGSATFLEDLDRHSNTLIYERETVQPEQATKRRSDEATKGPEAEASSSDPSVASSLRRFVAAGRFRWQDATFGRLPLTLDTPPDESALTDLLRVLGQAARDAKRVEVPFDAITPDEGRMWSLDSAADLHVPVGRTGATRLQTFRLGHGVAQHALIAGKTGSGKSTLLNGLITNLCLWYAPDQLELYLIDFKRGVEFKAFAATGLPHVRAVAIESDREFGLSVLQRLDRELARRGETFRAAGVQDLASYRRWQATKRQAGGERAEGGGQRAKSDGAGAVGLPHSGSDLGPPPSAVQSPMPRVLLVVDEFQEMFTEDDKLTQDASLLIDRLARQGRAFGIHLILGSQTIGGQTGLGRATLGQMAVRVALQCTEADSQLILGDNNSAARLLSRPGEAIYNDAGGTVEHNSPFQVAWLDDAQRDSLLDRVRQRARAEGVSAPAPIVFEGNAAADIGENQELRLALQGQPVRHSAIYLGNPVAIKEPTHVLLRRQSGSNVVVIGQQEENVLAVAASALISLTATASEAPEGESGAGGRLWPRFILLDGTPADAPRAGYLAGIARSLPAETDVVDYRAVPDAFADLAEELRQRLEVGSPAARAIVLLIHGIQRYRLLTRSDDSFGSSGGGGASFSEILGAEEGARAEPAAATVQPDQVLMDLLRSGPTVGMHVVLTADTPAGLERRLTRESLREFDSRVLFQMSGNDSSLLVDSLAASRLGFYRALLASEEQGTVEKFRPYAPPDEAFLAAVAEALR